MSDTVLKRRAVPNVAPVLQLGFTMRLQKVGLNPTLLAGLVLVRAPLSTYLALSSAPVYVAWKVGLYARALLSGGAATWVRTSRHA